MIKKNIRNCIVAVSVSGALGVAPLVSVSSSPVPHYFQATVTSSAAPQAEVGTAIKVMLTALKKYSGTLYSSLKSAVISGYKSFLTVWDKIPGWIKALAGSIGSSTIYDWLKDHLSSWL